MSNPKGHELELQLRGSAINISIKFEIGLMDIVYFSHAKQYINAGQSKSLKIKNITFGRKIERTKKILASFHPDLLDNYESVFTDLEEFATMRNKLAHCDLRWLDEEYTRLQIWDVAEDGNKFQFYTPTEYSRLEVTTLLLTSLRKIANPLISLQKEVRSRLKETNPEVYSVLTEGLKNDGQAK